MKTIYICWTDEFTNRKHVALWLLSGNEDDVIKAQEYIGNIDGKVLTYPVTDNVSTAQARKDYEALLFAEASAEVDHNKNWYDTSQELS